jgi:hypothetical protein
MVDTRVQALASTAQAHLDGTASRDDARLLEQDADAWADALHMLRARATAALARAQREVTGPERDLVLDDFRSERDRIDEQLQALTGTRPAPDREPHVESFHHTNGGRVGPERTSSNGKRTRGRDAVKNPPSTSTPQRAEESSQPPAPPGVAQLQLSWWQGRIVAWGGGANARPDDTAALRERLAATGAPTDGWIAHEPVRLPDGGRAESLEAPVRSILGWLVALNATAGDEAFGSSATWMGLVATLAVRLVGQGRMVPQLARATQSGNAKNRKGRASFEVRWAPARLDHDELSRLAKSQPGAVAALDQRRDAYAITQSVLDAFVDAMCRDAAARVPVPAAPPNPRTATDVAESILARLDGTAFDAPNQQASEIGRALQRWAEPVTGTSKLHLVLQLDPPDDSDAWYLKTLVDDGRRRPERVEPAMSKASDSRREEIKGELERLEMLYEPLARDKSKHRGEVILGQDAAWELMTTHGPLLTNAGFEVRVPPMSPKRAKPSLRVTATGADQTVVGAQQLTSVRWAAVFDDVELTAQDIQRLAAESRPLVKSHGRWVAVDHADLEAAAEALAERADRTKLSGAQMLRYALGLEDTALGAGIAVAGDAWAANLLTSARDIPENPPTRPDGFAGELRGYQADALAWLEFLDSAGLGGCLALDMGLGKTPTMLAHLRATTDQGPGLVIAPPAVVGNWASEARRFTPDLRVVVHHGTNRADGGDIAEVVASADVLITTYGTALRDIGALDRIAWGKVVLDEAQVIKNPASETAQQLRRLEARTRVVLTGTPIENGLGDLWSLMDFTNPGLVGDRATFVAQLSRSGNGSARSSAENALRALNGVLVFRRTKSDPAIAAELPDRIDELDHCPMTAEQIGLYQAVLDDLVADTSGEDGVAKKKGAVLAAITALKQICNHPSAYTHDDEPLDGRSGKLVRLDEIVDNVFAADERVLIFTHFASWGERLATYLTARTGKRIPCYHGGLARGSRDRMIADFQRGKGAGALVLSLKAGGTGLNLTAASHVVLYDRWWNPAVEDQARDRAWRIGQTRTVVSHRLVCPGTVDERVEEVVAGKRRIADMVLPRSSTVSDLDSAQLQTALGIDPDTLLTDDDETLTVASGGAR